MPRLFVAAQLNKPALELAVRAEGVLRDCLRRRARIRWTKNDSRHVTLAFLGQVDDAKVAIVSDCLQQAIAARSMFEVRVGTIGAFPTLRRARVLWVGVRSLATELDNLVLAVRGALLDAGFELDGREYKGHLTLGRVADRNGVEIDQDLISAFDESVISPVDAVVLFESHLAPSGARYRQLKHIGLQGS